MPFEGLFPLINSLNVQTTLWLVLKWMFLVGWLIYLAFAIIVVRQVNLMSDTLDGTSLNLVVKTFAWIHLAVSLLVFFLGLTIL